MTVSDRVERAWRAPGGRWSRARGLAPRAAQAGAVAGAAWWLAVLVISDGEPTYAVVTAIVAMGAGRDRRWDRSFLIVGGMLVGIVIANYLTALVGRGAWQVALVAALSIAVGTFLFDDELLVSYAGFNGAVLAALGTDGLVPDRLLEALVGSAVALAGTVLLFPRDPLRDARETLHDVTVTLARHLATVADALREADAEAAAAASAAMGGIEPRLDAIERALELADREFRWELPRRRKRPEARHLHAIVSRATPPLRAGITSVRLAARLLSKQERSFPDLADAVSCTVDALDPVFDALARPDGTDAHERARVAALAIADRAGRAVDREGRAVTATAEELRGVAADALDALGLESDGAEESLQEARRA